MTRLKVLIVKELNAHKQIIPSIWQQKKKERKKERKKEKETGNQKLPLTREHIWVKEGIWSPYPFQPWAHIIILFQ